ncbi:hypothetical protein GCM10025787_29800 [Saccharopolyspora rosea]
MLRCDNGPELACVAMADWAHEQVGLHFIPPGEPWRNGYVESFNSRIRDECLNIDIFWSLAQARVVISDWKDDYSHRRRHSSLGYQVLPPTRQYALTDERPSLTVDGTPASAACRECCSPDRVIRIQDSRLASAKSTSNARTAVAARAHREAAHLPPRRPGG